MAKKKSSPKKKAVIKPLTEREIIDRATKIINNFMRVKGNVAYHRSFNTLVPVYQKLMVKIPQAKLKTVKPLFWGLKRLQEINPLQDALIKSAQENDPKILWVQIIKSINWLNNKNK